MTTTVNILDKSATLAKIRSLKGRSATITADIQTCAVSALSHAAEYGDLTLCTKLVRAVSATNGTKLRKYFAAFGPVAWDKKAGGFKKVKKGGAFRVADAIDNCFDTYAAPKVARKVAGYDAEKVMNKAANTVLAALESALDAGDIANSNKLAEVYATLLGRDALNKLAA